jgi:hypothetical protein
MKIQHFVLFLSAALATIILNFWQAQLVQANEGKVVTEIGKFIAPKLIEQIFKAFPGIAIATTILVIAIIWLINR